MRSTSYPYNIRFLGDSGLQIDFGNQINVELNRYLTGLAEKIKECKIAPFSEVIVDYTTITIFFERNLNALTIISNKGLAGYINIIDEIVKNYHPSDTTLTGKLVKIPVCYHPKYATDMQILCSKKNLTATEIIEIHCSIVYQVYMIGFLPGFPYMGELPQNIQLGRKEKPVTVAVGSVGIAGNQTGIYPLSSPGGWNIIGCTPLQLFNPHSNKPCMLKAGDRVQFIAISEYEFNSYQEGHI